MRQAGRYLPEYRRVRAEAGGFLDLCYTPKLARVTLQPIRRYGFDASIVFADILLVPHAMGQKLWFETGEGPRWSLCLKPPIYRSRVYGSSGACQRNSEPVNQKFACQHDTYWLCRCSLDGCNLHGGRSWHADQAPARELAQTEPEKFQEIIDMLVDATTDYLAEQISAGADVVQLFESWAASLQGDAFERWCVKPVQAIVAGLRAKGLKTPVIGFPRAHSPLAAYAEQTQCDVLALDTNVDRCLVSAACGQDVVCKAISIRKYW